MLKKSLSLLLIIIMSLTAFAGIASAAATAAHAAPDAVNGATYYLNKTFSSRPGHGTTETLDNGTSYTWDCPSGYNSFSTEYNALSMTARAHVAYNTAISAAGDYVVSLDFMAPTVNFTGTDSSTKGIRIMIGTYWLSTIGYDGTLSICKQSTGQKLQAGNWYRLTAQIALPSGDITATVKNLTTGSGIATKSATAASTTIPRIRFDMPAVISNPLYTQNWILYKEKDKVPAPAAPADVEGATYYLKKDFTARPSGTETPESGIPFYWNCAGANAYDSGFKALGTIGYHQANFGTSSSDAATISTPGNYVLSMDVMAPNTAFFSDPTAQGARINIMIGNYVLANIQNGIWNKVCYLSTEEAFEADKWYRITAKIAVPSGNITATVTDMATGEVIIEKTQSADTNLATIGNIQFNFGITAANPLYTQSWRLYKLENKFEKVDNGTTITASYILEEEGNAVIAVALFDATTGVMDNIAFERYENHTGVVKAEIAKKDGYTARAFLWNGDTLAPLFPSI